LERDHSITLSAHRSTDGGQAQRLGGFEVDDELLELLDGQVRGTGSFEIAPELASIYRRRYRKGRSASLIVWILSCATFGW
jgi:hypothetical protein